MSLVLLAATDQQGAIGKDNQIPWKNPFDLRFFKEFTTYHPVIMGRKTFESIGQPLSNRHNIVLTRDESFKADDVYVANNVEDVFLIVNRLSKFEEPNLLYSREYEQFPIVIGGGEIYKLFLPYASHFMINKLFDVNVKDADTYIPTLTEILEVCPNLIEFDEYWLKFQWFTTYVDEPMDLVGTIGWQWSRAYYRSRFLYEHQKQKEISQGKLMA